MASVSTRYQTFRAADRAAELRYGPGPTSGTDEWTDENRELALDSTQAAWDALPLWLRMGLCLRHHWVDAVYEASPRIGEWLVARREKEGTS